MTWYLNASNARTPEPLTGQTAKIPNWWESAAAQFELNRIPSRVAGMAWVQGTTTDFLDAAEKQAGITGGLPASIAPRAPHATPPVSPDDFRKSRLLYIVSAARKQDPRAYPGLPATPEEFDAELSRQVQAHQAELNATLANQPADQWGPRTLGGLAEFVSRPSSVVALPLNAVVGPEAGMVRFLGAQGALGAGQQALDNMDRNAAAPITGEAPMTLGEQAASVAEGAAMGIGLGAAFHYGGKVLGALLRGGASAIDRMGAYQTAREAMTGQHLPEGTSPLQGAQALDAATANLGKDAPAADASPDTSLGGVGISNTTAWQSQNLTTIHSPNGQSWTVNTRAAQAFTGFLNELEGMGYDVKSSGGFNYRNIRGRDQLSEHARGLAIDINAETNPLGGATSDLPPNISEIAAKWGLKWGGDFKGRKDPMHFEYVVDGGATGSAGAAEPMPYRTSRGYTGEGQIAATGSTPAIDVTYQVVDASTLQRAGADLQPRDTSAKNSPARVAKIAAELDPAQLMPSPIAAHGTPIVGPDNIIESGNHRFAAIARAYDQHPDRAAAYRSQIEAAGYAIPDGVDRPVLIARRNTDFSPQQRRMAVQDWQDSGVAQMTPSEMARVGASRMTPEALAGFDPAKPITHPDNAAFLKSTLDAVPTSARNAMFEKSGALNRAGLTAMREALFARAWPDADILARYAETNAGDLRSLLDALEMAAPAEAALKGDIEAGRVAPEMDIGPYVLDAMRIIAAARETATREAIPVQTALNDALDQIDFEHGATAPLTAALARKFMPGGIAAPAKTIGAFLTRYAEEARQVGATGALIKATPHEILTRLDPETFANLPQDLGQPRAATMTSPPAAEPIRTDYPTESFALGAASPEAMAGDAALKEELTQVASRPTSPSVAALSGDGPRQLIALADLSKTDQRAFLSDLKAAQPYTDAQSVLAAAETNHAALNDAAEAAAQALGLNFKRAPVKKLSQIIAKVEDKYAGDFTRIADVARTGITAPSIDAAESFVRTMAQTFHVIDEGWQITDAGYFDRKLMVRFKDGQLGEIQIWPPGMADAKSKADLSRFGTYPETFLDPKTGATKPFVGGHKLYEISRDPSQPEALRTQAVADMRQIYGEIAADLDPSFAQKLGIDAPRSASAAATSAADTSTALSSPSTSSAMGREPPAGAQALPDQNTAKPLSDTAQRSDPSSNSFMGNVPSLSQDAANMAVPGSEVKLPKEPWADLVIRTDEKSPGVSLSDLMADIEEDMRAADVLDACNPKGPM